MKRKTIKFKEYEIQLEVSTYRNNNRLAILAYADDEPYSDVTINLPDMYADGIMGFINDITKSCGLEDKLVQEGIITDVLRLYAI